jgi:hypothetical protein
MKKITILLLLSTSIISFSQELTGNQLLEKAIKFHDPKGNWVTFNGEFFVTMETPKSAPRESKIHINLPKQYFSVIAKRDTIITAFMVDKDTISFALNSDKNPSEELKKKHGLNPERADLYKNYYTYLYGLPMKLKDEGTIIHQKVTKKKFQGNEYLVLKVTYLKEVGKDTWYFYFNPETYAMEVYQFFKDESKNDGEYIVLSGLETINHIKIPKNRAWYYNKNDGYLGTDTLITKKE